MSAIRIRLIFSLVILMLNFLLGVERVSAQFITKEKRAEKLFEQKIEGDVASIGFIENKGQMMGTDKNSSDFVLFKAESPGLDFYVTERGITYNFIEFEKESVVDNYGKPVVDDKGEPIKEKIIKWNRVDMTLKGARIKKENIFKSKIIEKGNVSYFLGHCPDGIFGVKTYSEIIIKDVYEGIDWKLYISESGSIKQEFIVAPYADPNLIKLVYEGKGEFISDDNTIGFSNNLGEVNEGSLFCYQEEKERVVKAKYNVQENESHTLTGVGISNLIDSKDDKGIFSFEVSVELGEYQKNKELTIDPEIVWTTVYGGNGNDGFMSADVDSNNNLFIGGYCSYSLFPVVDNGSYFTGTSPGVTNGILMKFSNTGAVEWATYYGGANRANCNFVEIDVYDNLWVTGYHNSSDFPVFNSGGYFQQPANSFVEQAFILKFDNVGNRLWATSYRGNNYDEGYSICSDQNGNVFVVGKTKSSNFPRFDPGGGAYYDGVRSGTTDSFILKFDNNGNRLWATFYGGSDYDIANSVSVDNNGDVWVSGETESTDLPVQDAGGYYQNSNGGGLDAYFLKFSNSGNRLWGSYYGGSNDDYGSSMVSNSLGDVWVLGSTESSDLPTFDGGTYFDGSYGGNEDLFIVRLANSTNLDMATYYGGSEMESWFNTYDNMDVDECDNVYITGFTHSADLNPKNAGVCHYFDGTGGGGSNDSKKDHFILMLDQDGHELWGSYFGSQGKKDYRSGIAVDGNKDAYLIGEFCFYGSQHMANIPWVNPGGGAYFNNTQQGWDDSYVSKFHLPDPIINKSQSNSTDCLVCDGVARVNVDCGTPPYDYVWSNGVQNLHSMNQTDSIVGLCPGNYSVNITTNCNMDTTLYFTITGPTVGGGVVVSPAGPFCVSDASVNLLVSGTGGTWTGTGIVDSNLGTFAPSVGPGMHTVIYSIPAPCEDADTINITVLPLSDASITAVGPYCVSDLPVTLSSVDAGGVWSGNGITDATAGTFDPATAGVGTHTITYTISGSCGDVGTTTIVVTQDMDATITAVGPYCVSDLPVTLSSVDAGGVWSGNGITDATAGTFDPATAGVGTHTITYTIAGSCGDVGTTTIVVTQDMDATITAGGPYCVSDLPVTLSAIDAGGVWSGNGITDATAGTFDPATAGVGIHTITYTIAGSCGDVGTTTIVVTQDMDATITSVGPYCVSDLPVTLSAIDVGGVWSGNGITDATAGTFDPATAGVGTHTITYTISGSCGDVGTTTIVVTQDMDATITAVGPYCVSDLPVTLSSVDAGGVWSGNGITDATAGTFDPATAGVGTHTITYTISGPCGDVGTTTIVVSALPAIDAGVDLSICIGSSVTLSGSGGSSFVWNNGVINGVAFVPTSSNVYYVSGSDANGCVNQDSVFVDLLPLDDPMFSFAGGNTFCQTATNPIASISGVTGGVFTFFSVSGGGVLVIDSNTGEVDLVNSDVGIYDIFYTTNGDCPQTMVQQITITSAPIADFSYAEYCSNDINPLPTYINGGVGGVFSSSPGLVIDSITGMVDLDLSTPGTYTVSNEISSAGCGTILAQDGITIYELPWATISGSDTICPNDLFPDLTVSITSGASPWNISYNVNNIPSHVTTSSSVYTINGVSFGTYELIDIIDSNGCVSSLSGIAVIDSFSVPVMFPMFEVVGCAGEVISPLPFISNMPGSSYEWENITGTDIGFGLAGTGDIGSFTAISGILTDQIITIEVTPISANGCEGIPSTFDIIVHPIPDVQFEATPLSGCEPLEVEFTNLTTSSGNCLWNFGDGYADQSANGVTHVYSSGLYDVSLTVEINGCANTLTYPTYIEVYDIPVAAFSFSPKELTEFNTEVHFTNESTMADAYNWDFGDESFSELINPIHTYQQPGAYTITLIASNNDSTCYSSTTATITVEEELMFYVPNAFTPNGDGENEVFVPVMTSGYDGESYEFLVFNRWGELIFESSTPGEAWNGTFKGSIMQDGVYIWKLSFKESGNVNVRFLTGHVTLFR